MSKKTREEIKKLESMKATMEAEVETLKMKKKNIKNDITSIKNNINNINQRIVNLSKNKDKLTVSEHAIIRYFERVVGVDIEQIAEQILPIGMNDTIKELGNGQFPVNEGEFRILVKDGMVITVLK